MSGADTLEQRVKRYMMGLPGKRGIDVPTARFDRIHKAASGVTQPLWGRPPTPHQLQWMHDNNVVEPDQIEHHFSQLPHPHAPGMTVAEYEPWSKAHQVYTENK